MKVDELHKIVVVNAQAIAYLERTVASLEESLRAANATLEQLRRHLDEKPFYGDWNAFVRYHESQAAFYREMVELKGKRSGQPSKQP